MNLLIIGGLLAVGVLAIIGAVLLGISEQRAEVTRRKNEPAPALPANRNPTVKLRPVEEAASSRATATETTIATVEREQGLSRLNGQFHELVGEIRSLHQQAQNLERRLGVLTEMVDHIERTQSNHTSIEEDIHVTSDHTNA
ncbi:MAG: hypothetical protein M3Y76_04685 [Chloroflexota bacterium]|nr:hypothetical protein [Chloroflexota bacterium]